MKKTNEKIRQIRRQKNYTQAYMGVRMNISQVAYGRIENGKTALRLEQLEAIAEIFEVPVSELLTDPE